MNEDLSPAEPNPEASPLKTPEALLLLGLGEFLLVGIGYVIRLTFPMQEDPSRFLLWQGKVDLNGSGIGVIAGLLLFAIYHWADRFDWDPMTRIRDNLHSLLGPALRRSSWTHLAVIGLSAGLCEEYLFRGVLEPRLGFLASNLLFALLHPHSILYVILAFTIGGLMSLLVFLTDSLWAAILAHAIYDFAVLTQMARDARSSTLNT